jgi:hypothetical protein
VARYLKSNEGDKLASFKDLRFLNSIILSEKSLSLFLIDSVRSLFGSKVSIIELSILFIDYICIFSNETNPTK